MAKDEIGAIISGTILGIILILIGRIFLATNATGSLATFYNNVGWGFVFAGSLLIGGLIFIIFIVIKNIRDNKVF